MKVWTVEVCQCDEYGCMSLIGIFDCEESAYEYIKEQGLQTEDYGEAWNRRSDYARVEEWEVCE